MFWLFTLIMKNVSQTASRRRVDAEEVDVFPFIVRSYDESVSLASVDIGSCRCDFQAGVVTAVVAVVVVVFDNIVDINVVVLFIIIVLEKQIFDASLAVGHSL